MIKRLPVIAALVAGLAASLGSAAIAHGATTTHTCVAEVALFEDGSWRGGRLLWDGRVKYSSDWEKHLVGLGWLPGYHGTPCVLTIINR